MVEPPASRRSITYAGNAGPEKVGTFLSSLDFSHAIEPPALYPAKDETKGLFDDTGYQERQLLERGELFLRRGRHQPVQPQIHCRHAVMIGPTAG